MAVARARIFASTGLIAASAAAAVAVSVAAALLLREPFGPLRLFVKSIAPVALALPFALALPAGALRTFSTTTLAAGAIVLLTGSCLGVYGVPLRLDVLVPLLALTPPAWTHLLAGATLLLVVTTTGRRTRWVPLPAHTASGLLVAAFEAVYFCGFLLGSTQELGAWSWAIVGLAQTLAARVRGVPLWRAVLGSGAVVGATLFSGSSYVAFLAHVSLLGQPTSTPQPSLLLSAPALR